MDNAKKPTASMENASGRRPDYRRARFLTSAGRLSQCPPDRGREVAFAGRSNAGKSSAINALTGNGKLARTSRTPGRTQLINFFSLGEDQRLVDLPGYGYARAPEAVKREWNRRLELYLQRRRSLRGLVMSMDVRHPSRDFDRLLPEWATAARMPVHILLTKADKLGKGPAGSALLKVRDQLAGRAEPVSVQLFSAPKRIGLRELSDLLDIWLAESPVPEGDLRP